MPLTSAFYAELRKPLAGEPALFPHYTQQQVDALNSVTAVFDAFTGHDHCNDDLAYIMATCYHECGASLNLAIEEIGKGAKKAYGQPVKPYNKRYYGRGPPQVTWLANYQKAKLRTGIDFVQFPEYMCQPARGIVYMIDAMYAGLFTKYMLRNFITPGAVTTLAGFTSCRKIINGTDHDLAIGKVAQAFQAALAVGYAKPAALVTVQPVQATPQVTRLSLWAALQHMFGGK